MSQHSFAHKTSIYSPSMLRKPVPGYYAILLQPMWCEGVGKILKPGEAYMLLNIEKQQSSTKYISYEKSVFLYEKLVFLYDTQQIKISSTWADKLLFVPISPMLGEKRICITGTLRWDRAVYEQLIKLTSGEFKTSVSKNTDYLLIGEAPGNAKLSKAKFCGTPILKEDEFFAKFFSA